MTSIFSGTSDQGGFFFTARDGENLITREKEVYDGAAPSGNSVALLNLLRLVPDYRGNGLGGEGRAPDAGLCRHRSGGPPGLHPVFERRGLGGGTCPGNGHRRGPRAPDFPGHGPGPSAGFSAQQGPAVQIPRAGRGTRWRGSPPSPRAMVPACRTSPKAYICEQYACRTGPFSEYF